MTKADPSSSALSCTALLNRTLPHTGHFNSAMSKQSLQLTKVIGYISDSHQETLGTEKKPSEGDSTKDRLKAPSVSDVASGLASVNEIFDVMLTNECNRTSDSTEILGRLNAMERCLDVMESTYLC